MKLVRVEENFGFVEHGNKEYKVELSLIENAEVGQWILAHADLAVSRLPEKEALEILKLINKANCSCKVEHAH